MYRAYLGNGEYVFSLVRDPTDPRLLTNDELIDLINMEYYKKTLVGVIGTESEKYYNNAIEEAMNILKDGLNDRRRYGGYTRGAY